jgi:MFS family permease
MIGNDCRAKDGIAMGTDQAVDSDSVGAAVEEVRPGGVDAPFNVWRWVHITVAAMAMVATLPGRTHGLGLITEPVFADLPIGRVSYAVINLWATLIGALFCLPVGWLQDRLGSRIVLLGVALGLAASVLGMSGVRPDWGTLLIPAFFTLVMLTRGFGQSALSVVSLALMGRSVGRKAAWGVGVYSFITALGFMAAFGAIKYILEHYEPGWRLLWAGIGISVTAFGLLAFLFIRPKEAEGETTTADKDDGEEGLTLGQTLTTPAFWVFALATSLYGLIAAGISLFNQSILQERQFPREVFLTITVMSPMVGLAANLLTGWLAGGIAQGKLLTGAMVLLAAAMVCFPLVRTLWQVYLYAVAMGIAGGMVTVIFFGIWARAFGTVHLGKIQGAAQMPTVLASAVGPLLLAAGKDRFGTYLPAFQAGAAAAGVLAIPRGLCRYRSSRTLLRSFVNQYEKMK